MPAIAPPITAIAVAMVWPRIAPIATPTHHTELTVSCHTKIIMIEPAVIAKKMHTVSLRACVHACVRESNDGEMHTIW